MEPFSQLDIKVLRYDTRMSQRLVVDDGRSHDIHGEVFFVLEPLCMPFETPSCFGANTRLKPQAPCGK